MRRKMLKPKMQAAIKQNMSVYFVEKTVASGHFAAALALKASTSPLFHDVNSSNTSSASSKVILGRSKTAATSLSTDFFVRSFRISRAEITLFVESLFLDRYSLLYFVRSVEGGRRVNSDLITSKDFGAIDSCSASMASLKRMIWEWTLG